jgi:predicted dithiol-disulfide oxidoreductase (DUF899 family)
MPTRQRRSKRTRSESPRSTSKRSKAAGGKAPARRRATERDSHEPLHLKHYPGESATYRRSRDELLRAEIRLRRSIESVAALRRDLPAGGLVREDYIFGASANVGDLARVRMSELFAPGKHTLVLYSFMYGPGMARPCPACTSMLDALDASAQHIMQRVNLAVVAKSPLPRIMAFARERGWRRLKLLSSSGNSYNEDYFGESADGRQLPMLNVFVKQGGSIRHFWGSEMLFMPADRGQNERHVDMIWPLWNLFDLTPEGRGTDWFPRLAY